MDRKLILALVAVTGAYTAGTVMAEPQAGLLPLPMQGSDTLREVTRQVIQTCALDQNIDYQGGGSTRGGDAMRTRHQQISPQSRFLSSRECTDFGTVQRVGQGITVGLDGIGVLADATEPTSCEALRYSGNLTVTERNGVGGLQCPSCSGNTYNFSDWRDVLRILYAGQSAHINADPCLDADVTRIPSDLGTAPPGACGNGALEGNEQCDDGNTTTMDGCSSNCTWEIGNASRCNSDLRHELVSVYSNIFQGSCSDGECTGPVHHVFRRDDLSGTTDTFLTLLGLPAATTRTFCNGFELEDLDPIRRPCDANEQACNAVPYANRDANPHGGNPTGPGRNPATPGGDLGLVVAVTMPADLSMQFGETACFPGRFSYAPMPTAVAANAQRCPDGNKRKANKCRWPLSLQSKFNCIAKQTTLPPVITFTNMDGRAYNLVPRNPDTGELLLEKSGVTDPRFGGGGFYRIHQTTPMSNGSGVCTEADATQQLGCLVVASPCSISFAGREALFSGTNKAIRLRSPLNNPGGGFPPLELALDDILIRRLLDPSGPSAGTCGNGNGDNYGYRYPLARRLWVNAARGFGLPDFSNIVDMVDSNDPDTAPDLVTMERELAVCLADRTLTDQAIVDNGYITLSDRNCTTGTCTAAELAIGYRARSCDARCGDGLVQPGESCDDGNRDDGDGCPADCTVP